MRLRRRKRQHGIQYSIDASLMMTITTPARIRFVVSATEDGALRIVTAKPMFVQWAGDQVCEIRQLRRPVCQKK